MSSIYHRHRGGNRPHVHRDADESATPRHDHGGTHQHDHPRDHSRGYHAYDVHGCQPAIVQAAPGELSHWHFDGPFEHIAPLLVRVLSEEFAATAVASSNHDLNCLPLAARPPPALV